MNGHLLDANVLIALAWPAHTSSVKRNSGLLRMLIGDGQLARSRSVRSFGSFPTARFHTVS